MVVIWARRLANHLLLLPAHGCDFQNLCFAEKAGMINVDMVMYSNTRVPTVGTRLGILLVPDIVAGFPLASS